MTQVEFEIKLVDLKNQRRDALAPIHEMLGGVKEKISAVDRQIKDLRAKREELNQQRIIISNQLQQQQKQWYDKIASFTTENFSETRTLENISDWTIAKELHRRGFTGVLEHSEKTEEFLDTMNKNLNHTWETDPVPQSGDGAHVEGTKSSIN